MRPWFTLAIIAIIAGILLSFWLVVDFVLLNRMMFETPFNITVRLPFSPWSHQWTEVQFMYILTVSILLGAGIVALVTLIFDTKRALKVRRMRKKLTRLQKALEDAQAKLPEPPAPESAEVEKGDAAPEESMGDEPSPSETESSDDETVVTPEDITHSFENVVEQGDFLKAAQKRVEDEMERHAGHRPAGDIRTIVTGEERVESSDNDPDSGEEDAEMPSEDIPGKEVVESTESKDAMIEEETPSEENSEENAGPEKDVVESTEIADAGTEIVQEEQADSDLTPKTPVAEDSDANDEMGEEETPSEEIVEKIAEPEDDRSSADEQKDVPAFEAGVLEANDAKPREENVDDASQEETAPVKKAPSDV